jgi:7,8-dihydro-6-hydroxymethylpterin-pyrophosphokinase
MLERNFVLIPLAEIAPGFRHPSWKSGIAQLLAASTDRSAVRKLHDAPSV